MFPDGTIKISPYGREAWQVTVITSDGCGLKVHGPCNLFSALHWVRKTTGKSYSEVNA